MATKARPSGEMPATEELTALPEVIPYQLVIRMAHERSLETK